MGEVGIENLGAASRRALVRYFRQAPEFGELFRNSVGEVLDAVRKMAEIALDDGLESDAKGATAEVIREQDDYSGVRVTLGGRLSRAMIRLHVDLNVSRRSFHESVLNAALEHDFFTFEFVLAYLHVADQWQPPGAAYYVSDRLCSRSAIMVLDAWSSDRTRMTMRSRQDTAP